mmetsp:Transcript_12416/g.18302  ORF Transcript_12416/g.18302 Transcript_12416/m.18302 type:complete len:268 (-) Transcript_12416:660-1463(-)
MSCRPRSSFSWKLRSYSSTWMRGSSRMLPLVSSRRGPMKLFASGSFTSRVKGRTFPFFTSSSFWRNRSISPRARCWLPEVSWCCTALSPRVKGLPSSRFSLIFTSRPSTLVYSPPRDPASISISSSGMLIPAESLLSTSLCRSFSLSALRVVLQPRGGMAPPPFTSLLLNPQLPQSNAMMITSLKCGMSVTHMFVCPGVPQWQQFSGKAMTSFLPTSAELSKISPSAPTTPSDLAWCSGFLSSMNPSSSACCVGCRPMARSWEGRRR